MQSPGMYDVVCVVISHCVLTSSATGVGVESSPSNGKCALQLQKEAREKEDTLQRMLTAEKRVRTLEEDNRQLRREVSEIRKEVDKLRKEVRHPISLFVITVN